jgi:hypothetical protein
MTAIFSAHVARPSIPSRSADAGDGARDRLPVTEAVFTTIVWITFIRSATLRSPERTINEAGHMSEGRRG